MADTRIIALLIVAVGMLGGTVAEAGPFRVREHHQRERIAAGVRDGSLTPAEARVLHREQRNIERLRRRALRNDGRISPVEARQIKKAQDRASRHIRRLRHNEHGRTS